MIRDFGRFYDRHSEMVYRIALQLTGDPMEAEDVCHDVFIEVMNKWDQFDPERGSVEAWLAVRAKSRSIDRIRRRRRVALESLDAAAARSAEAGLSVETAVVQRWERHALQEAMLRIPEAQRRAIVGAYFDDRTHTELARDLGRPLGTVKSLIRSGLRSMRKMMTSGQTEAAASAGGDPQ